MNQDDVIVAIPFSDVSRDAETRKLERTIAEAMISSVRRHMPDVKIWQLTDEDHTEELPVDVVSRCDFDYKNWVPWLTNHLAKVPGKVLFMDSDVIVQRDLRPMFLTGADVTVTSRGPKVIEGREMPFLIGCVASRTPAFWIDVRDRVLAMPDRADRDWWGIQVALFQMHQDQKAGTLPWTIASVACDPHNYVPKTPTDLPADKWVLHFKGRKRKQWMLDAFCREEVTS